MKVKVSIPESLADIKLSQYQKFIRTTDGSKDDNFINRQKVTIFCNVPDEMVGKLKKSDYDEMIDAVNNVLNTSGKLQTIINYNGIEYGFIPDNFENITVSELADLDNYMKDVKDYHKAMAVLYRPITNKYKGKYLIEEYEANGNGLDLPMDIVSGAVVFFSDLINDLLNCTQNSIIQEVMQNSQLLTLVQNGVGISHFTDSLAEAFSNLKKLAS